MEVLTKNLLGIGNFTYLPHPRIGLTARGRSKKNLPIPGDMQENLELPHLPPEPPLSLD